MAKSTKTTSTTSYRETAFGVLPRLKVVQLEKESIKKAQQYILSLSEKREHISPQLIRNVHKVGFGFIFPDWAGEFLVSASFCLDSSIQGLQRKNCSTSYQSYPSQFRISNNNNTS